MKVAFYKGTKPGLAGLFNRAVRWWTNGPYSHCEILIDGKGYSSSNLDGGVRSVELEFNPENWDFVELSGSLETKVKTWFLEHDGEGYDLLGLIGFVLRRGDGDKDKWYCSEAVSASLGFEEPWRFDPNTLYRVLCWTA